MRHYNLQDSVCCQRKRRAIKGQFCMGSNSDMDKGSLCHEIRYVRVRYKWSRVTVVVVVVVLFI